ncbi:hypothetical protein [Campylobacter estrildidarum]|nr:hypothetical protein [Campylobacter estrildidarum]
MEKNIQYEINEIRLEHEKQLEENYLAILEKTPLAFRGSIEVTE